MRLVNQELLNELVSKDLKHGKIRWFKFGKEVPSFELNKADKKTLDKICGEADRQERWRLKTVDVFVRDNGTITIDWEIRKS